MNSISRPAVVALLACMVASTAFADDADARRAAFEARFGMNMSRTLIVGVAKACPFVRDELARAAPDDLVLLLTNGEARRFSSDRCDKSCDYAELNRIVVECRTKAGIDQCRPFAALHRGEIFDLTFDPSGPPLAACLEQR